MEDRIKAKIIEAVPEIMERVSCGSPCQCFQGHSKARSITLADVLRAMSASKALEGYVSVDQDGNFRLNPSGEWNFAEQENGRIIFWNLTTDYDGQTQEVKDFIGSLLGGDAKRV